MRKGPGAFLAWLGRAMGRAPAPARAPHGTSPDHHTTPFQGLKVVMGLGNPGPEYETTRHNAGWWLVDHLQEAWQFGPFRKEGSVLVSEGQVRDRPVLLLKPLTYMNRSGLVLDPVLRARRVHASLEPTTDLLVVVDDATRPAGGVRFRPGGSAGGHNGLKSIESALGSRDYPRLRLGVGQAPPGANLADWVLSPMPPEDEAAVLERFPSLEAGVRRWMEEGIQVAMDHHNR